MDAVMDLSARAVAFITIIQDTFFRHTLASKKMNFDVYAIFHKHFRIEFEKHIELVKEEQKKEQDLNKKFSQMDKYASLLPFESRLVELIWISRDKPIIREAEQYLIERSEALIDWFIVKDETSNEGNNIILKNIATCSNFPAPVDWREAISQRLYNEPYERIRLAKALHYLPTNVILALGAGNLCGNEQRIIQLGMIEDLDKERLLNKEERKLLENFFISGNRAEQIDRFLTKTDELIKELIEKEVPLPFEYVFHTELDQIISSREFRLKESCLVANDRKVPTETNINSSGIDKNNSSPFKRAEDMHLIALACSGGGIRSATFCLGIIQGLAKKGWLNKLDYLSTVSGGGYIGSWLATWIKRDGSVGKVADRLNPAKSTDPLAEEVRPIRWLRMFSNYLTPMASIMSVDAWTVGVTWFRNMLLNQIIILMLFITALLLGKLLYVIWIGLKWIPDNSHAEVSLYSGFLLVPIAVMVGAGMHAYRKQPLIRINKKWTTILSYTTLSWGIIGTFLVSAWLFSRKDFLNEAFTFPGFLHKLQILTSYSNFYFFVSPGFICFLSLLIVAIFGNYVNCITGFNKSKGWGWIIIILTALFSALIGVLALTFAWDVLLLISKANNSFNNEIAFTVGVPLMLQVLGVTVVTRMALLGIYFPDERREWWGRIGAMVNRFAFLWLLVAGSALLARDILHNSFSRWIPATLTGWITLVVSTVKAAFSAKSSGKDEAKGFSFTLVDILSKTGPYLFIIGLLIFLPALLDPLESLSNNIFKQAVNRTPNEITLLSFLTLIIGALAYLFARCIGVNEFSMHHFYRNRLVRAYMGATRRRTARERTANPFTNFDMMDDEKLSSFTGDSYYGPYPILNAALNASQVSDLDRQDRKAESFIFSPLYCGFDFSKVRSSDTTGKKSHDYGYRPTNLFAYNGDRGPAIGTAMAISGAAVNPNQGYHTSAATAFLLTVFNVQMGWWIGNPRQKKWKKSEPDSGLAYIVKNLIGRTHTGNDFVCLSDGGHFDNMGLYELIRRKCSLIILLDGEQDENFTCEGLANAIRRCRIDFGVEIDLDVKDIVDRDKNRFSMGHYAIGKVTYTEKDVTSSKDEKFTGKLVYIKSSIVNNERSSLPVDILEYAKKNPAFPHQTTADQFFNEEQFESYRKLGLHISEIVFSTTDQ